MIPDCLSHHLQGEFTGERACVVESNQPSISSI